MSDEKIIKKLDNIENILKMMLVNSVINENETQTILYTLLDEIRIQLEPLGLHNIRINNIEEKYYVFSQINIQELKKIREIYLMASDILKDFRLVLVYEKLPLKRKQAFEKSEISYYILSSGEMRIY